jgi:predicted HNH restriction endonuclease
VLCANCHRMVHRKNPPYTIEELKAKFKWSMDLE